MTNEPQQKFPRHFALLMLLYAATALLFTFCYTRATQDDAVTGLAALADFKAPKPYQYRVLSPLIIRGIHDTTHLPLRAASQGLDAVAMFGVLVVYGTFLRAFVQSDSIRWLAPLIAWPLYWHYGPLGIFRMPSDIPGIFLFVLGLRFLYLEHWKAFLLLFAVATINRETTCFLTLAFVLTQLGRRDLGWIARYVTLQIMIWLAIKLIIMRIFSHAPGSSAEQHFYRNLTWLKKMDKVQYFLGFAGGLWIALPFFWKQTPLFLKRLFWVAPPFMLGMLVVGRVEEYRIYGEMLPILLAPVFVGLARVWESQPRRKLAAIS